MTGARPIAPNAPTDPGESRNTSDPGDETQRNFRYQHAYGVILLAAAKRGVRPYFAIWCEHHEDLLTQRLDGCYDGYQIKTSRPENGAWRMLDAELVKSIGRFVDLVREFSVKIGNVFFVTNTEFDHVGDAHQDEKRRARRPREFLSHVHGCGAHQEISPLYLTTFEALQGECGCTAEELFVVLKKLDLILGPSRDSIHAVVAHEHLGAIPGTGVLAPAALDGWRDNLIAKVCAASSLAVTDPIRHLRPLIDATDMDPALQGKRLIVEEVMINDGQPSAPFVFLGDSQIQLGVEPRPHVLQAKLEKGHIGDQIEYLRERERAAEAHLMEDAVRDSTEFPAKLRQLEEIILGECTEAHLRARIEGEPYGDKMLIDIQDRLRRIASGDSARVFHEPYDCLIGLVGLLTTDTRVWFSSRFPVQEGVT